MFNLRRKTIFFLISSLIILSLLACSSDATPELPDIETTVQASVQESLTDIPASQMVTVRSQDPLTTPWNLSWVEYMKRYNTDPRLSELATKFQWKMVHNHTGGHPEYWWPEYWHDIIP